MGKQAPRSRPLNIKLPATEWDEFSARAEKVGTYPTTIIKDYITDGLETLDALGIRAPLLLETDAQGERIEMVTKPYWLPDTLVARVKEVAEQTGWTVVRTSRSLMALGMQVEEAQKQVSGAALKKALAAK